MCAIGLYRERLIARKRAPTGRGAFEGAALPTQRGQRSRRSALVRDGLYRERGIARERAPTERAAFEGAALPAQRAHALVGAHLCAMGFTGNASSRASALLRSVQHLRMRHCLRRGAHALVGAHLCAMGFTGNASSRASALLQGRLRTRETDETTGGRRQRPPRPLRLHWSRGLGLDHYGCAGGAALALAIISATEAVVIG